MAERVARELIAEKAIVHPELPIAAAAPFDRSFEMPSALYGATVALYLGFMAVAAIGFGDPELILPMAVIVLTIVAGFGVPGLWVRMAPGSRKAPLSWSRFRMAGIMTEHGHVTAPEAMVQVLILPVLIFLWGIATVTIAAIVR